MLHETELNSSDISEITSKAQQRIDIITKNSKNPYVYINDLVVHTILNMYFDHINNQFALMQTCLTGSTKIRDK